jgi:hypothetical protein
MAGYAQEVKLFGKWSFEDVGARLERGAQAEARRGGGCQPAPPLSLFSRCLRETLLRWSTLRSRRVAGRAWRRLSAARPCYSRVASMRPPDAAAALQKSTTSRLRTTSR